MLLLSEKCHEGLSYSAIDEQELILVDLFIFDDHMCVCVIGIDSFIHIDGKEWNYSSIDQQRLFSTVV